MKLTPLQKEVVWACEHYDKRNPEDLTRPEWMEYAGIGFCGAGDLYRYFHPSNVTNELTERS